MSNVAKLKKKAAELEERRQYDKALAVYEQVLDQMENSDEDLDVSLFNRVGDLTLRQGRVTQAVAHYEKAVDLYTDGGFFNNAIALCNKILRNAPGRTTIYYKLGRISARKGFTSDAKLNFLEYADRMQKAGQWEEAFSALEEFADLCPDQDDVRLMLAEQLTRQGRKSEALVQLQILYGRYTAEGRETEASATLERMRAIDPDIVPQLSAQAAPEKISDLVFLDVNYDEPPGRQMGGAQGQEGHRGPAGDRAAGSTPLPGLLSALENIPSSIDPRASGSMRIVRPIDQLSRPLTPSAGSEIVRQGDGYDLMSPDMPGLVLQDRMGGDAALPESLDSVLPIHDLALAGILPALDTPGLLSNIPPEVAEIVESDDDSSAILGGLELQHGGMLDSLIPGENFESLELQPSGSESATAEEIEIGTSTSETHAGTPVDGLTIVHGSGLGAGEGSAGSLGAESLVDSSGNVMGAMEPMSSLSHDALKSIAWSASEVSALLRDEPGDFNLHRRLGEVLIEDGKRGDGLASLETAMLGFETAGQIADALSIAEMILRLEPDSIRHHQKRVEYSFRTSDQALLVDSYLELADALFRTSQLSKASVVYERVLELSPDNARATYAIAALIGDGKGRPDSDAQDGRGEISVAPETGSAPASEVAQTSNPSAQSDDDTSFVNLGDLLREDEGPRTTRMVVDEEAPSGDEEADFADMLEKFKRGLAENVDDEDYESHYDLGIAFREMGLLDEAIAQFQRALRGSRNRTRTLEALGQCFVERSQFQVAVNVLGRALSEGSTGDENLVGVLYLLGYASEAMHKYTDALGYYQRVFMVDIQFRDVTARMSALEKMST